MKTIILHAGTHKTGTSALQLFASRHADVLQQLGIYYPMSGRPVAGPTDGHHLLAWSVADKLVDPSYWPKADHSVDSVWNALLDEVHARPEPTILLSSEEFSFLRDTQVRMLPDILSPFDIVPILYFRRFDEYLQAAYSTNVLLGERRNIHDYIQANQRWLSYTRVISAWRPVFGATLAVRPFHRNSLVSGSVISDLLSMLGHTIEDGYIDRYSQVNAGVPWNIVECARMMNILGASFSYVRKLWYLSYRLYTGHHLSYELLPPLSRKTLIQDSIPFFEQEFRDCDNPEFWRHMRGEDLPDSNTDWETRHRHKYSFLSKTMVDTLNLYCGPYYGSLAKRVGASKVAQSPTSYNG